MSNPHVADPGPPLHKLERARLARGLNRAQLAAASGVNEKTIYSIEREGVVPRVTTRRCLAAALKMPTGAIWPSPVDLYMLQQRRAA